MPAIPSSSVCACATVIPGAIRPKMWSILAVRVFRVNCPMRNGQEEDGMYTSFSAGYCGTGGSTPITV